MPLREQGLVEPVAPMDAKEWTVALGGLAGLGQPAVSVLYSRVCFVAN